MFCLALNSRYFGKFISTLRPPSCLPESEEGGFATSFSSLLLLDCNFPFLASKFCLSERENPPWNERISPGKPKIFLLPWERCSRSASFRGIGISQNPVPCRTSQDPGGTKVLGLCPSVLVAPWGHLGSRDGIFPVWDPVDAEFGEGQQDWACHSSPAPPGAGSKFQQSSGSAGICRAAAHPKNPKGQRFPCWGYSRGENPWGKAEGCGGIGDLPWMELKISPDWN